MCEKVAPRGTDWLPHRLPLGAGRHCAGILSWLTKRAAHRDARSSRPGPGGVARASASFSAHSARSCCRGGRKSSKSTAVPLCTPDAASSRSLHCPGWVRQDCARAQNCCGWLTASAARSRCEPRAVRGKCSRATHAWRELRGAPVRPGSIDGIGGLWLPVPQTGKQPPQQCSRVVLGDRSPFAPPSSAAAIAERRPSERRLATPPHAPGCRGPGWTIDRSPVGPGLSAAPAACERLQLQARRRGNPLHSRPLVWHGSDSKLDLRLQAARSGRDKHRPERKRSKYCIVLEGNRENCSVSAPRRPSRTPATMASVFTTEEITPRNLTPVSTQRRLGSFHS